MKRSVVAGITLALGLGGAYVGLRNSDVETAAAQQAPAQRQVPKFQVDAAWPKPLPNQMILGIVSSVTVDEEDHVWVLHRPRTLEEAEVPRAAPALVEFDPEGNYLRGWGGTSTAQYDWPQTEHGVYLDHDGFVWIGGNGNNDQILKFTKDGTFVMRVGDPSTEASNLNQSRLGRPADTWVHEPTNELFVADGYGNRRVMVFDATSGAFKRMWGAFGLPPTDGDPDPAWDTQMEGNGPPVFVPPVHAARVSDDGLVYVSDRGGKRVQVFTIAGDYVNQVWIGRECVAPDCGNGETAASTAFSTDPGQQFLYVANRSQAMVMVLDRRTLEILDSWGGWGSAPGQFGTLHHMAVDSRGNLFTTEVTPLEPVNRRVQKFTFTGLAPM